MQKIIALTLSLLFCANSAFSKVNIDELKKAMRDEIKRSLSELSVESLQRPYYVEYTLNVKNSQSVKASLGGLLSSRDIESASITVGIRVGNSTFDNTNFFDVGLGFFGSGDDEESFKNRRIPVELDYQSLRRELWLATDACYKQAAELYSKKEASIKNRLRTDTTPDFATMPAFNAIDTNTLMPYSISDAELLVKNLSSVFSQFPAISASTVSAEYLPETIIYVNSEGREFVKTKQMVGIEIVSSAQSKDGMPLAGAYTTYAPISKALPSNDSLMKAALGVAQSLQQALDAEKITEPYSGPMLFVGQAAAEAFAQNFAPNLIAQRPPLTDRGVQDNDRFTAFQNKIGGRVLPEFLSVLDNPTLENHAGTSLVAHYAIDDEGVPAQQISLVEKGYLKTLLTSRIPTKRIKSSNGHSRGGAPIFSTLHLTCNDKKKEVDLEAMKKRMMKLCKDRDLPFGIMVKHVLNQNILYTVLYEQTSGEFPFAQGDSKLTALEVYKVFPDGREERVRGGEIAGIGVSSFKDILLVGKKHAAYNYYAPAVISSFLTGGSQFVSASLLVPDILFEDIELRPLEADFPKPPLMPAPSAVK